MKKNELFLLRLQPDEKMTFQQSANLAGISLSAWARERLRRAAIRELQEAGEPVPFLEKDKKHGK